MADSDSEVSTLHVAYFQILVAFRSSGDFLIRAGIPPAAPASFSILNFITLMALTIILGITLSVL